MAVAVDRKCGAVSQSGEAYSFKGIFSFFVLRSDIAYRIEDFKYEISRIFLAKSVAGFKKSREFALGRVFSAFFFQYSYDAFAREHAVKARIVHNSADIDFIRVEAVAVIILYAGAVRAVGEIFVVYALCVVAACDILCRDRIFAVEILYTEYELEPARSESHTARGSLCEVEFLAVGGEPCENVVILLLGVFGAGDKVRIFHDLIGNIGAVAGIELDRVFFARVVCLEGEILGDDSVEVIRSRRSLFFLFLLFITFGLCGFFGIFFLNIDIPVSERVVFLHGIFFGLLNRRFELYDHGNRIGTVIGIECYSVVVVERAVFFFNNGAADLAVDHALTGVAHKSLLCTGSGNYDLTFASVRVVAESGDLNGIVSFSAGTNIIVISRFCTGRFICRIVMSIVRIARAIQIITRRFGSCCAFRENRYRMKARNSKNDAHEECGKPFLPLFYQLFLFH